MPRGGTDFGGEGELADAPVRAPLPQPGTERADRLPTSHDQHYGRCTRVTRFPDRESTSHPRVGRLAGMVKLTQTMVIDVPAGAVWRIVAGGFDRIGDWGTAVPSSAAWRCRCRQLTRRYRGGPA